MESEDLMDSLYHCPRCQSSNVNLNEEGVHCPLCKLTFDEKFLMMLDDEDILANEELEGIFNLF